MGYPVYVNPPLTENLLDQIGTELSRALSKFPEWPSDPLHAVSVLGEEYGELQKAVLQSVYEPHKSSPDDVKAEAIQVAAMAIRFLHSLENYRYQPADQHSQ